MAKLKKGMDAEGKADIQQALTLAPGLLQFAGRYGLTPPPGTIANGPPGAPPVNP